MSVTLCVFNVPTTNDSMYYYCYNERLNMSFVKGLIKNIGDGGQLFCHSNINQFEAGILFGRA